VYVNLPSIGDEEVGRDLHQRTEELADEVERLASLTRELVRSGDSRDPLEDRPG
jgi:formiminotetrahydrofolate cyclodeaminase